MSIVLIIGRIAFVAIFAIAGAQKLMNIAGTATYIQSKVYVPSAIAGVLAPLAPFVTQVETATGLSIWQILAIIAGVVEIVGAILIVFDIGTRFACVMLVLFVAVATFYFHDFWNMVDAERATNMVLAQKNLSIIGGLLILFALCRPRGAVADEDTDGVAFLPRRPPV